MARHPDPGSSIGRRQFMAAGAAATVLPAWSVHAAAQPAPRALPAITQRGAPAPGEALVLSGRLCSLTGHALAGARLEFAAPGEPAQVVDTDADGRFLLHTRTPAGALGWRASVDGHATGAGLLALAAGPASAAHLATAHRDDAGVWRASAALVQG